MDFVYTHQPLGEALLTRRQSNITFVQVLILNTKKHYGLTTTMLQAYCSSASSQALADVWADL